MNANTQHHGDVNHTIDRALSALRDPQPRSGLEGRILANLEHSTIAPQPLRPHFSIHFALWTATAAAIIAIASLIILHHHITPNEFAGVTQKTGLAAGFSPLNSGGKSEGALAPAHSPTDPVILSTTNLAQTSIEPTHRMAHRSATTSATMAAACAQPGCPIHDDDAPTVMNGASQTPTDAQLLADLHAPSHPAPPLPLTSEEKLFLRMLEYGNATQLAELDPLVRAKHDADETTAFKTFFPDPPPLKQPLGDAE